MSSLRRRLCDPSSPSSVESPRGMTEAASLGKAGVGWNYPDRAETVDSRSPIALFCRAKAPV